MAHARAPLAVTVALALAAAAAGALAGCGAERPRLVTPPEEAGGPCAGEAGGGIGGRVAPSAPRALRRAVAHATWVAHGTVERLRTAGDAQLVAVTELTVFKGPCRPARLVVARDDRSVPLVPSSEVLVVADGASPYPRLLAPTDRWTRAAVAAALGGA